MPITTANIEFRPSFTGGTRGNQSYQGNVNNALGKYVSTSGIVDNTLNNLFDDVTGVQNASGLSDYRCIFIVNNHATLSYQNAFTYILNQSTATISLGVDPSGVFPVDSSTAQATQIVDENTAPHGVTFSTPLSAGTALSLGTVSPSGCIGLWIRRTGPNSGAINADSATLDVFGDTSA